MKRSLFYFLKKLQLDALFRYLNQGKVLILAYHGVTMKQYEIPPWVHIPLDAFEQQIKHISQRYNFISLHKAVNTLKTGTCLPKNSAVITFDDGYKNNFTVAQSILKKYGVPATIFATAGYIGTDKLLPLDKAYLIIMALKGCEPLTVPEIGLGPLFFKTHEDLNNSYKATVNALKQFTVQKQEKYLLYLEDFLPNNSNYKNDDSVEDFLLLSWKEMHALMDTGLITFGAHTVTHDILTNITAREAVQQINDSRNILQENLNQSINLFAYPNGTEADYTSEHANYLRDNGFICSVTTIPRLNTAHCDPYNLYRICIGPELSANFNHFVLKISGFLPALKRIGKFSNVSNGSYH